MDLIQFNSSVYFLSAYLCLVLYLMYVMLYCMYIMDIMSFYFVKLMFIWV